jgi:hypothetical protein
MIRFLKYLFHRHNWGPLHYYGEFSGAWSNYNVFRKWCKSCGKCKIVSEKIYG